MPERRLSRRARIAVRVAVASGLLIPLAVLVLHSAPVRRFALHRASEVLRQQAGIDLRAQDLRYNLLARRATLIGLALSTPGSTDAPFFSAAMVQVRLSRSAFTGSFHIDDVSIEDGRLSIIWQADGSSNLPSGARATSGDPPALPIDRIQLDGFAVNLVDRRRDWSLVLPSVTADVRGSPGSIRLAEAGRFERGDVSTAISRVDGVLSFDGRALRLRSVTLATDEMSAAIDGVVTMLVSQPRADIRLRGRLDTARVARWAPPAIGAPTGLLDIDATVEGPLASLTAQAAVSSSRLALNGVTASEVRVRASVDETRVSLATLETALFGGRITARGTFGLADSQHAFTLDWSDVDGARLQRSVVPSAGFRVASTTSGSATVEGRGFDWTAWTIAGGVSFAPRTGVADGLPVAASLRGRLADRRWTVSGGGTAGDVALEADLRGSVNAAALARSPLTGHVTVRETTARDLVETIERAGFSGASLPADADARLTATIELDGAVSSPDIHAAVAIRNASVAQVTGIEADIAATGTFTRLDLEGVIRKGPRNTVQVTGALMPRERRFRSDVAASIADPGALLFDSRLTGRLELMLEAEGPLDAPTAQGTATATNVAFDGIGVERATALLRVEPSTASITIESGEVGLRADAALDRSTRQVTLDAEVLEASLARLTRDTAARDRVTGMVTLRGRGTALLGDWRGGVADVELDRFEAESHGVPIRLVEPARLSYQAGLATVTGFDARVGDAVLAIAGRLPLTSTQAISSADAISATLTGNLRQFLDMARANDLLNDQNVTGHGTLAMLARATGTFERLDLSADVELADAELTYAGLPPLKSVELRGRVGGGVITVAQASAEWQEARLTASATLPLGLLDPYLPDRLVPPAPTQPSSAVLDLQVQSIMPPVLEPFVPSETLAQIEGRVDASAHLELDRLAVEAVRGEVRLDRLDIRVGGLPIGQREPTRVAVDRGIARVESWNWIGQGATAVLQGDVRLLDRELSLLAAGRVDLQTLTPFVSGAGVALSGAVAPRIALTGPIDSPRIDGEVAMTSGEIRLREPRLIASNLHAFAVLSPSGLRVSRLTGSVNGGDLTGDAFGQYPEGEPWSLELRTQIAGMGLEYPAGLRSELDADLALTLTGTPAGPSGTLSGDVTLLRSAYREPLNVVRSALTALRQRRTAGTSEASPARRIALNIRVATEDDVAVDNNVARLQIAGDLRVIGTAAVPLLSGRALFREGGQLFLGRNAYTIESGTVDFVNPEAIEPTLHAEATTRAGGHEIELVLDGTPENLDVDLRSRTVPELGQADVASLLLTGRLLEDVPGSEGRIVGEQVLAYVSGDLLGVAGRAIGLDNLRLGETSSALRRDPAAVAAETDPISRLTFGKTFGEHVELTFSQSLRTGGASTWIVDYRPVRQINLRLVSRDDNLRDYEFQHDVSVGGGERRDASRRRRPDVRIRVIHVRGTAPLSDAMLRDIVDLSPGQPFDVARWQRGRTRLEQELWRAGFLEARVGTTREDAATGVELTFDIEAGPRTVVTISGYDLARGARAALEQAWTQAVFDDFFAEEVVGIVRSALADDRHHDPVVSAQIREEAGQKTLIIDIVPGPRARERRVTIHASPRELSDELTRWVRDERLEALAWRDPDALTRALTVELITRGYADTRVTARPIRMDGSVALFGLDAEPGPRYTVASVRWPSDSEIDIAAVRESSELAAGSVYTPVSVDDARARLIAAYRARGFTGAAITVSTAVDDASHGVAVDFDVVRGPQDVLRTIDVRGNRSLDADVVERALDLDTDQPLGVTAWLSARGRLFDTALFRRVDVTAEAVGEPDAGVRPMRVVATVQEWPALRVRYGFQLSEVRPEGQVTGRDLQPGFSADATRRTLFGRAVTLGAALELQQQERLGRVFASAPTMAGLPIESLLTVERAREEAVGAIVVNRLRASWEQRVRITTPFRVSYSYSFERNRTAAGGAVNLPPAVVSEPVNIARLTTSAIFDTRDDPTDTGSGSMVSMNVEYAPATLGSDVSFVRQLVQAYHFRPWRGVTLASAARVGTIVPRGSQLLLATEMFSAGGARTVRGIAENGLGPLNLLGEPAGGHALVVLNQEARFPIFRWVRGVGFFDAGGIFARPSQIDLRELTGAFGGGLRVTTPFALLRVDYGRAVFGNRERRSHWFVGIGQAF